MDIILRIIYHVKNSSRRLFSAIFYRQAQLYAILLGMSIIVIGAILQNRDSELLRSMGSILIGIGGSVFASGLVVKILSRIPRNPEEERLIQTGTIFIGDRLAFNEQYQPWNQKGWNAWIKQTPRGGHLIISGKEQRYWLEESWPAVRSVLQKHIETNFIFLGLEEQVKQYHQHFMGRFNQKDGDQHELTKYLKCWKYVPYESHKDVDDFGFYWNGRVLLVKMYLHDTKKENCPIIGFATPGVSPKFNIEDFDTTILNLSNSSALIRCAWSLNHIWSNKQPFSNESHS